MPSRNYYVVLGVASTETSEGIRAAFRALAKRLHPDQVGISSAASAGSFRELTEAYDVLRDPERRKEYDASLLQAPAAPRASLRNDLGVQALDVDVAISRAEADRGTRVRLGVDQRAFMFDVPPMSGGGSTFVVPLRGLGIRDLHLRVRVRVDNAR